MLNLEIHNFSKKFNLSWTAYQNFTSQRHVTRRPCCWSFNTIEYFFSKNLHEIGVKFPEPERNAFGLDQELLIKELRQYFCACAVNAIRTLSRFITTMTHNSLNPACTFTIWSSKPFFVVLGVHTFGPDNSNPSRPMSFPNYSDPLVANWSSGRDSITLTPRIFDSVLLGTYWPFKVVSNCTVGLYCGTNFDSLCRETFEALRETGSRWLSKCILGLF